METQSTEANARLIAAAPDLLSALQEAQVQLYEIRTALSCARYSGMGDVIRADLMARAAIARARA